MKTGDFRGAGPFADEWILEEGRQAAPDDEAPKLLALYVSDAGEDGSRFRLRERDGSDEAYLELPTPVEVER